MSTKPPGSSWTAPQWRAISRSDHSILVSAAAGSGKTAVLAERCAYLVCHPDKPCSVDELLVVTFTKAAAAEMKSRIERVLRARQLAAPEDEHLERQLLLIDRAAITTLDGFCGRIVRRHFDQVGIDPAFVQLDEHEAEMLRLSTARALIADRYDDDETGEFQRLVDTMANGNDELIVSTLLRLSRMLGSLTDPSDWLSQAESRLSEAAEDFESSLLGAELRTYIERQIVVLIERAEAGISRLDRFPHLQAYSQYLQFLHATLVEWQEALAGGGIDAFADKLNTLEFPKMKPVKNDTPDKALGVAVMESVRKEIKKGELATAAMFTTAEWQAGVRTTAPAIGTLLDLLRAFESRYAAAKSEQRALDFTDLERFAFAILRDPKAESLSPSTIAREYQKQFAHVLVDEYQDINALQNSIIRLLSRETSPDSGEGNLFCVGDVKQSIYRFRLADPGNFLSRERSLRAASDDRGEVIDLQANFRSRGPLLEAINMIFERVMTATAAEIEYDATHKLVPGAIFPAAADCFTGQPIELHVIETDSPGSITTTPSHQDEDETPDDDSVDDDFDRIELEGLLIARRIREFLGLAGAPPRLVTEKSSDGPRLRPIEFRDFAILLRATRYKSDQLATILRSQGIAVQSDSRGGFFDALEVRDMLSLLRVLENSRLDIPFAAVLRSPIVRLDHSADALARIRIAYPVRDVPFHLAVTRYANEKRDALAASLTDILNQIGRWRTAAQRQPLSDVISRIYDESGYLAFASAMPGGMERVANLIQLHERATQFGTFQRQGLSRFLAFIESLEEESDVGRATLSTGAENAVRIMSVHQSKGLEFPVVFVPDLGKRLNKMDLGKSILLDRDRFIGVRAIDLDKQVHYPSASWLVVRDSLARQLVAEELRVMYVALTRAREHLILIGSDKSATIDKWLDDSAPLPGKLPDEVILKSPSPMGWLGPATRSIQLAHSGVIDVLRHSRESVAQMRVESAGAKSEPARKLQAIAELKSIDLPASAAGTALVDRISTDYPFQLLTLTPAVQAVTSVTKRGRLAPGAESRSRENIVPFESELPPPKFTGHVSSLSPADRGTLTHDVLQNIRLAQVASAADVSKEIERLISARLVGELARTAVDAEAVAWFGATDLGRHMAARSKDVRREIPVYQLQNLESDDPTMREESVLLRGRIDALVPTDDGWVIVDYKTDQVTADTVDARAAFYRDQVEAYAQSIESISGERVVKSALVFLAVRQIIEITR